MSQALNGDSALPVLRSITVRARAINAAGPNASVNTVP